MSFLRFAALSVFVLPALTLHAADWTRFRGPDGSGVAGDSAPLPTTWSPDANLA